MGRSRLAKSIIISHKRSTTVFKCETPSKSWPLIAFTTAKFFYALAWHAGRQARTRGGGGWYLMRLGVAICPEPPRVPAHLRLPRRCHRRSAVAKRTLPAAMRPPRGTHPGGSATCPPGEGSELLSWVLLRRQSYSQKIACTQIFHI